eukprot:GHVU01227057.1.p2 GENE.GHVU01227057.1~~GHVU01227057.1.p2  ORF type:complete len:103 (+),score=5.68 GHVU01227057.1:250-558(+)
MSLLVMKTCTLNLINTRKKHMRQILKELLIAFLISTAIVGLSLWYITQKKVSEPPVEPFVLSPVTVCLLDELDSETTQVKLSTDSSLPTCKQQNQKVEDLIR